MFQKIYTILRLDSIKSKMLLFLLLPVILCFTVASSVSYSIADTAVGKYVRSTVVNDTMLRATEVEAEITVAKSMALTLAGVLASPNISDADTYALFKRLDEGATNIDNICVGYADKRYIKSAEGTMAPGYDPTARSWYINSANNPDKVLITNAYVSQTTGRMVVTFTKAVVRNGSVVGVVAAEVNLDSVKALVMGKKVAKTGYGLIIDNNGMIVIHPTIKSGEYMQKIDNGALESVYNQIKTEPSGTTIRSVYNGVSNSYCAASIKGTTYCS